MVNKTSVLFIFGITIVLQGFTQPVANSEDTRTNHVVLISIDGLAAYHLKNEGLELPNLRELIAGGVWPESSKTIFPSVTHPSHATLITGVSPRRHGILGNEMTHRQTGTSQRATTQTRKEAIHTQTLFDLAHRAGLTTASFCWPETRGDTSIDYNILHGHGELDPAEVDPDLMENLRRAGIPIDTYYDWAEDGKMVEGYRDVIMAKAAAWVIKTHRPEFVAIHFKVTDVIQHGWGPDHYLAHAALTLADHNVGVIRQAISDAGLEDRATFLITADHGFHTVNHELNIYPVLKESGLAERVRLRGSGWSVFLETAEDFDKQKEGPALRSFFDDLLSLEGMAKIIHPDEFHALGYPRYEESLYVPGQYIIVPAIDTYLVVDSSSASAVRRKRSQPSHAHGYLPDHPRMHPAMVLSGNRIKKGKRSGMVRNLDVAPTIAEILGLKIGDVEGKVLWQALENPE